MGNTSSERAGLERHGHKASRGDSSGGAISPKEGDRPKILMDSPEDADLFHSEEMKVRLVCSCLLIVPAWGCCPAGVLVAPSVVLSLSLDMYLTVLLASHATERCCTDVQTDITSWFLARISCRKTLAA